MDGAGAALRVVDRADRTAWLHRWRPAGNSPVLGREQEDGRRGYAVRGDVEPGAVDVEHLPGWRGGCVLARRRRDRDRILSRRWNYISRAVIDGGQTGTVVGHPERACRAVRDVPRIDEFIRNGRGTHRPI